ncbi:MAG: nucleotidyltransferase family protein [Gammaproteobacteria bacterium]|nr:nucleotidyltransferase family protein [Gammaproteobacteria bacterium]
MNPLIERHRNQILTLAAARGVKNVRLFGSMVRDDDATGSSDVDLLVELSPGRSGFALGGFLMDMQDLLSRKVDVVTEASLHPRIRKKVLQQAIRL